MTMSATLTTEQAAAFLQVHKSTVLAMARSGALVGAKIGREWRFAQTGTYSGFTWHGMRHTWATWHVQNGTPLDVLQKLGGWASYSMVLRYGHHSPGYLAGFADNTTKDEDE